MEQQRKRLILNRETVKHLTASPGSAKRVPSPEMTRYQGGITPSIAVSEIVSSAISTYLLTEWVCPKIKRDLEQLSKVTLESLSEVSDATPAFFPDRAKSDKWYACFSSSTLVQVPGGVRSIDKLRRGDPILAMDLKSGKIEETVVTAVEIHEGEFPVRPLAGTGKEVLVTPGHLFWSSDSWVFSHELPKQSRVRSLKGEQLVEAGPVSSWRIYPRVFNLKVEGLANYLVGEMGLLARDH